MFRATDRQTKLFSAFNTLTDRQRSRIEGTWANAFRAHALPLIDEQAFSGMYHESRGAPNKPVRMMIGILVLKDLFDLTDEETLDALLFDVRWQVALDLEAEDAQLCQKTLHNFRVALMDFDLGPVLFERTTDRILQALELDTGRQRMDSTHTTSHLARLTRLGTCCETIRLLMRDLKKHHVAAFEQIPQSLRLRYLRDDNSSTKYDDATREQARRRLPVAARDLWRLYDRFQRDEAVCQLESFELLQRALDEQCEIVPEPQTPKETDADAGEEPVPAVPREKLTGRTLASPHDPDASFGGKGLGYEVQLVETFGNKNPQEEGEPPKPEIITYVSVSDSCGSDVNETLPAIDELAERNLQPRELEVDSNYTSSEVVIEAEAKGTDVNGPVKGGDKYLPGPEDVTTGDFVIDTQDASQTRCPNGQSPTVQTFDKETGKIELQFATCGGCQLADRCPTRVVKTPKRIAGQRVLRTTVNEARMERRRRYQTTQEFRDRYAFRSGIEAANSELKRGHGLGRLRVRRRKRVQLAVLLKVLACNLKRFIRYRQAHRLWQYAQSELGNHLEMA